MSITLIGGVLMLASGVIGTLCSTWPTPFRDKVMLVCMLGLIVGVVVGIVGLWRDNSAYIERCDGRCEGARRIACGRLDGPHRHDEEGSEFSVCQSSQGPVLKIAPK